MTDEEVIKPHSITLCEGCGIILYSCRCPGPHTIKRAVCCSCKSNSVESRLSDADLRAKHPKLNFLVEESSSGVKDELRQALALENVQLKESLAKTEAERDVAKQRADEYSDLLNECGVAAGMRAGDDAKDISEKVIDRITLLEEKLDRAVGILANGAAERKERMDKILELETRVADLQQKLGAAVEGYE